jgi:pimeloyl-ACP methyl ester carboxylesterase
VAGALSTRFSVYAFDLLGFGASDQRAEQDLSLAAHGERLARLLEYWGLECPAIVAHDIGGAITLRAHLLHDRRVRALTLLDVVAVGAWGSPFYRLVHDHSEVFEQLPAAIHAGLLRAYIGTAQPRPIDPATESALMAPWLSADGQSAFYRQIAHGDQRHTDEIEPLYDQICAPTLVIWGEADPWIPVARGVELTGRIRGARLEVLSSSGHLVQEDEPAAVIRLIRAHLEDAFGRRD